MGFDKGVDTLRCRREDWHGLALAGNCQRSLSRNSQAQNALFAIMLEELIAENLGKFSAGETAHAVELPQAVLRGDVPLSEEQVG